MKTVKVGSVGLGRLGYEHAKNLATQVPGCELAAICDVDANRVKEVAAELGVPNTYTDFEEMCKNPELDAIVIVSPSFLHCQQIEIAMNHGKHVFCEKPLGTDVAQCKAAEKVIEAHPDLIFQLGFMRRFDKSYAEEKRKIDNWFTGSDVKNVWAIGGVFEFDLYKELNDADNAAATIQMENGAMGFMFTNRTHAAGCNVETEIIGTHGTLRIANVGAKNLLNIVDEHGSREEYYPDFMSRWHEAFVAEMVAFTGHVRDNTKPADLTVYDGTAVSEAAYRCKESFETGKMLPIR